MVPAEVRVRHGLDEGTPVIFMESPWGLVLTSREALLDRIQSELEGSNLGEGLIDQRRRSAEIEDALVTEFDALAVYSRKRA